MSTRLRSSTRASTVASESLAETMSEMKSKSDTKRSTVSTSNRPLRGNELARLTKIAGMAFFASLATLVGVYYVAMNDIVRFYPSTIKMDSLKGFSSRAEYALRYQSLLYGWLIFNLFAVMYVRFRTKAVNPLVESTEKHAQMMKCILTNSYEQIVISSFLQFAFVSFADPSLTLKLIPAINIVQFVGRIAFFLGYPLYRTLGFSMTMLPNTALVCYNLYKFGAYLNLF